MVSRDYTKELGLKSATPKVPWPLAIALLALMAVGTWYGVAKLRAMPSPRQDAEDTPAAKVPPAPAAIVQR